jgi:hypothetical protein
MGHPRIGPTQPARPCKLTGDFIISRKLLILTAISASLIAGQATAQAKEKNRSGKVSVKCPRVVAGIEYYKTRTWQLQLAMNKRMTPSRNHEYWTNSCNYAKWIAGKWRKHLRTEFARFRNPPHLRQFMCIHSHEGSWTDSGSPYYGGLQMDTEFQRTYGLALYRAKGTADHWTWLEQIWVAERAYLTRGFNPWPTRQYCGL